MLYENKIYQTYRKCKKKKTHTQTNKHRPHPNTVDQNQNVPRPLVALSVSNCSVLGTCPNADSVHRNFDFSLFFYTNSAPDWSRGLLGMPCGRAAYIFPPKHIQLTAQVAELFTTASYTDQPQPSLRSSDPF